MGMLIHFEEDSPEEKEFTKNINYFRDVITKEVYNRLRESKEFDIETMKKIYSLLKKNL